MNVESPGYAALLEVIQEADTAHDVGLGLDGCPCFELAIADVRLVGSCWRTGPPHIEGCVLEWSGDSGNGKLMAHNLAEALKPKLDAMDWYGEWTLVEREWPGHVISGAFWRDANPTEADK